MATEGPDTGTGALDAGGLPEHVRENIAHWDGEAARYEPMGERAWAAEPTWGQWAVPQDACPLLPVDCSGLDVVELGCGTAYISGWAERRGAQRVVGVDTSTEQLATARRLADEHGADITFHHASAEAVPEPDASFDLAVSEYGAAIWCEPEAWLREAWRLLRPGGHCNFLGNHPLTLCTSPLDGSLPIGTELVRDWHGMHRFDWRDAAEEPGGIEFCLSTADWFALFARIGFEVLDYREPRPDPEGEELLFHVPRSWAVRWPSEQAWFLRKPTEEAA